MPSQWKRGRVVVLVHIFASGLDGIITQNNSCGVTKGEKYIIMRFLELLFHFKSIFV